MSFKSLLAYQKSFDLAMVVFHVSKKFPTEERFGLTSQKGHLGEYVLQSRRLIEREAMKNILKVNLQMRIVKIQKRNSGWILH